MFSLSADCFVTREILVFVDQPVGLFIAHPLTDDWIMSLTSTTSGSTYTGTTDSSASKAVSLCMVLIANEDIYVCENGDRLAGWTMAW